MCLTLRSLTNGGGRPDEWHSRRQHDELFQQGVVSLLLGRHQIQETRILEKSRLLFGDFVDLHSSVVSVFWYPRQPDQSCTHVRPSLPRRSLFDKAGVRWEKPYRLLKNNDKFFKRT